MAILILESIYFNWILEYNFEFELDSKIYGFILFLKLCKENLKDKLKVRWDILVGVLFINFQILRNLS